MTFTRCGPRSVQFHQTKQRSKGITKVIQRLFFPSYRVQNLRGPSVRNHGGLTLKQARRRGRLIDSQLRKVVGDRTLLRPPRRACEETKKIIAFIRNRGFYIEHAQYTVGYAPWRLSTPVDLVLHSVTAPDQRVVVEVKSGCLYRHKAIPNVCARYIDPPVPVSPSSMHQMQAVIGKRLYELSEQTDDVPVHAWLLYVDMVHGVELIEQDAFCIQWCPKYENILQNTADLKANASRMAYERRLMD